MVDVAHALFIASTICIQRNFPGGRGTLTLHYIFIQRNFPAGRGQPSPLLTLSVRGCLSQRPSKRLPIFVLHLSRDPGVTKALRRRYEGAREELWRFHEGVYEGAIKVLRRLHDGVVEELGRRS